MSNQPIDNGGPAFPCEEQIRCNGEVCDTRKFPGISIRDYFAAAVLAAVLKELWQQGEHSSPIPPLAAKFAYEMADAMLKAREEAK